MTKRLLVLMCTLAAAPLADAAFAQTAAPNAQGARGTGSGPAPAGLPGGGRGGFAPVQIGPPRMRSRPHNHTPRNTRRMPALVCSASAASMLRSRVCLPPSVRFLTTSGDWHPPCLTSSLEIQSNILRESSSPDQLKVRIDGRMLCHPAEGVCVRYSCV